MLRLSVLLTMVLAASGAQAEWMVNASKGYAFDAPPGWRMARPDYVLESRNGASLTQISLPPANGRGLKRVNYAATMMAGMRAGYRRTAQEFSMNGEGWQAYVTVFREPTRYGIGPRNVLQFVTKAGEQYWLFYLALPAREWNQNPARYKKVLASYRIK